MVAYFVYNMLFDSFNSPSADNVGRSLVGGGMTTMISMCYTYMENIICLSAWDVAVQRRDTLWQKRQNDKHKQP